MKEIQVLNIDNRVQDDLSVSSFTFIYDGEYRYWRLTTHWWRRTQVQKIDNRCQAGSAHLSSPLQWWSRLKVPKIDNRCQTGSVHLFSPLHWWRIQYRYQRLTTDVILYLSILQSTQMNRYSRLFTYGRWICSLNRFRGETEQCSVSSPPHWWRRIQVFNIVNRWHFFWPRTEKNQVFLTYSCSLIYCRWTRVQFNLW